MLVAHMVLALLIALFFGAILGTLIQHRMGVSGFSLLFFVLTLAIWVGGIWAVPFGPRIFGLYPYPFILAGLAVSLFAAALSSYRPRRTAQAAATGYGGRDADLGPLAVVFWMLIGLLAMMIVIRYLIS